MNSDVQIAGDPLAIPHLLPPVASHPSTVAGFAGLARSIAADRAAWAPLVRYDTTSRWYHRLRAVPQALGSAPKLSAPLEQGGPPYAGEAPIGYEVWLLSWVPGQGSGRHDHGASSGVLTVLEGELTEHAGTGPRTLAAGAQRVFAPGYVHEVVNDALAPAVSLHIYFPGLTNMPMHPSQASVSGGAAAASEVLAP
ncbi:cysteine dioxygenase [Streptomyces sp. NPDC054786]